MRGQHRFASVKNIVAIAGKLIEIRLRHRTAAAGAVLHRDRGINELVRLKHAVHQPRHAIRPAARRAVDNDFHRRFGFPGLSGGARRKQDSAGECTRCDQQLCLKILQPHRTHLKKIKQNKYLHCIHSNYFFSSPTCARNPRNSSRRESRYLRNCAPSRKFSSKLLFAE